MLKHLTTARVLAAVAAITLGFALGYSGVSEEAAASTTAFTHHERICDFCFLNGRARYKPCWMGGCKKCDAQCCPGNPGHDCCCIHNVDDCKCVKPKPEPDPTSATRTF